jgi:hypothetical protein
VRERRLAASLLLLAALALLAGPGATLYAASPCHTGAPMACCSGEEGGEPSPCGCSLSPVPPAPAVVEAAAPDAAPANAALPLIAPAPDPAAEPPAPSVAPRARAGPIFLRVLSLRN